MKRVSFLKSLPYLEPVICTSWPPKDTNSIHPINHKTQNPTLASSTASGCARTPNHVSKKRRIHKEQEDVPDEEIYSTSKHAFELFSSSTNQGSINSNEVFVSIEPCVASTKPKLDNCDKDDDGENIWTNLGPAFFSQSAKRDQPYEKITDESKEQQETSHQEPRLMIEQDPGICSFEAAIVIHTPKSSNTISNSNPSPFLKSNVASPDPNNTTNKSTTPNTTSTFSLSQSPKTPISQTKFNALNSSMSLYFRFERKFVFLVHHAKILTILKHSSNQRTASQPQNHDQLQDNDIGTNPVSSLVIQFPACAFRIVSMSLSSSKLDDNNPSKTNHNNIVQTKHHKELLNKAEQILQKFQNQEFSEIYIKAREQYKQQQRILQNQSVSNEGSSNLEPGQIEEQMMHSSSHDNGDDVNETPDHEEETKRMDDFSMSHEIGQKNDATRSLATCDNNDVKSNNNKEHLTTDNLEMDKKNQSQITSTLQIMKSKQTKNHQLSNYKRSWKAIETILQCYCEPSSRSFAIASNCSKDDEKDLANLLEAAANGTSNCYEDIFFHDQKHQSTERNQASSHEYYANEINTTQEKIQEIMSKLFPPVKKARKKKHSRIHMNHNTVQQSLSFSPYKTPMNSQSSMQSSKNTLSVESPCVTQDSTSESLESLVTLYEKNLLAKHGSILLPKR